MLRVGIGYDVHRLVAGRPLILGGINVPFDKGLEGHSDADVVLHAICDALLGAANCGDIGELFPSSDPQYEGISSLILLERTVQCIREYGYQPVQVDVTIVAQAPRLSLYKAAMRERISAVLGVPMDAVSVKATTTDELGFTGRGEGIAAYAIALVMKVDEMDADNADKHKLNGE